jgi:hypothetical protein
MLVLLRILAHSAGRLPGLQRRVGQAALMPFKSKAQMRWMFANHPEMAKRWAHETPDMKHPPRPQDGGDPSQGPEEEAWPIVTREALRASTHPRVDIVGRLTSTGLIADRCTRSARRTDG